jgi:hypothetical protein
VVGLTTLQGYRTTQQYANDSGGDAFVNEAFDFIFYFAAQPHFLFFIFRKRQGPHLSVWASGSVRE